MCATCCGELILNCGVEPVHAVRLGADRQVVPGAEILDVHPGRPAGRVDALLAGRLQLGRSDGELGPGLGRLLGIEPRLLERVLVDVEQRRRTVERQRQHVALAVGVVAGDRGEVVLGIEGLLGFLHHHVDGLDRALGRHHRRRPDLEHLQDVRRVAGTKRGDRRRHRFGVGALVDRDDLVVLLAGVEAGGDVVDAIAQRAGHRVPPLDFGLCLRGGRAEQADGQRRGSKCLETHGILLRWWRLAEDSDDKYAGPTVPSDGDRKYSLKPDASAGPPGA